MKKKLKALIALMSVCAVGAVGSAFALTRNQATSSGTAGQFDKAIYLYWGNAQSSVELNPVNDLNANVPVYRYLTVAPQSTKSVAGTVTVTFTLAAATGDYHINGLTVNVYGTTVEAIDAENKATYVVEANKVASVQAGSLTDTDTFTISASSGATQTTSKYYAIEVVYDGTFVTGKTLGTTLNISQSFAA